MELRKYQQEAVEAIVKSIDVPGNDLASLPTGSGKSIIIAEAVSRIDKPTIIFQPTKEILEQNVSKMKMYVDEKDIGVFSASAGEKTIKKFTFATIGSVYKTPELFSDVGLIFIDEVHLVNHQEKNSMFSKFLRAVNKKVIGLSATLFRNTTDQRLIYGTWQKGTVDNITKMQLLHRMTPTFWNRVIYKIDPCDLIGEGFLCPISYENRTIIPVEQLELNKSGSDYNLEHFVDRVQNRNNQIVDTVLRCQEKYNSTLVFCSTVKHAIMLSARVPGSVAVAAETKPAEREDVITRFRSGELKTVFNVGVLTTGFDHPALDSIVLLRPTKSISLYYQIVGRGVRISPGKTHCTLLDFTGTASCLGSIESFRLLENEGDLDLQTSQGWWHNRVLHQWTFEIRRKKKY